MDKTVTEWQIMFTMTSGLEDFYTEDEDEYNEKFQDLIDDGDLQYVEQCVRKDYVWNEELEDWDEDYVEVLYDAENYDDYKDTQRASSLTESKEPTYIVCSYYDEKLHGLEDELKTDDWSEVEDFAHRKLMQGNMVEIENTKTGKYRRINPDEYDETFDGEFIVRPEELEESKDTTNGEVKKLAKYIVSHYKDITGLEPNEFNKIAQDFRDGKLNMTHKDLGGMATKELDDIKEFVKKYDTEHNTKLYTDDCMNIFKEIDNEISRLNKKDEKYNVYTLNDEDGVYNSNKVDTVDTVEQAEDRVAELNAETGNNAYYEKADEWWEKNGERAVKYVANETPEAVVNLFGYSDDEDNAAWDMYMSSTSKSIALELYNFLGPEEFEKVLDEYERNLNESYASYEEPYNGKKMSKAQWKEIYDKEINHDPNNDGWETFEDWWYDMTERSRLIVKESVGDNFSNMVMELHSYVEGNPKTISQELKQAISNNTLDDYLRSKAAMTDDEIKSFKTKYGISTSKKTESKETDRQLRINYKKAMERELEKVQDAIANAGPGDISGLEDRRDFLMDKLNQIDSDLEKKEESINNKIEVEHYHLEDMGGHTMAVFGSLKDGRYFAGNEEVMTIYDEDIWPQYCEDDPDTTVWEKEHTLLSTSRYDTNKENLQLYYDIISQTSFFDDEDLEWFKEHLGLDKNDVADKKEESKLVEKTNMELQEEIEEKINNAIYQYLIKDGYETDESAKEFIKDYVVVKTWYEDMTSASSAEILEKYLAVEVRAELDYDDLSTLSTYLDKVVQKYDASSYFDFITGGTIRAYIQVDTRKPKNTKNNKKKTEGKEVNRANALLDLINEVYDGMGDMAELAEWAEILADDYNIDIDDESMETDEIMLTAFNKMNDNDFRNEVDNFIESLSENDGIDYLKDTLHTYPRNLKHIVKCLNTIKPYASEPDKIDTAIEELKSVNMNLRTTAEEFQEYLHDNFKPWTVLGTTTGPRTYVNLFEVPTDYDIVGADYFNYADRPSDMLDHIGYGWKQDGNNIVADLIGFKDSVKVGDNYAVAVYDQAPVKYGYSAAIDSSNKEAKFKEMANALMSKAKEIKEKYNLKESKTTKTEAEDLSYIDSDTNNCKVYYAVNTSGYKSLGLIVNDKDKKFQVVAGQKLSLGSKTAKKSKRQIWNMAKELKANGYEEVRGPSSVAGMVDESKKVEAKDLYGEWIDLLDKIPANRLEDYKIEYDLYDEQLNGDEKPTEMILPKLIAGAKKYIRNKKVEAKVNADALKVSVAKKLADDMIKAMGNDVTGMDKETYYKNTLVKLNDPKYIDSEIKNYECDNSNRSTTMVKDLNDLKKALTEDVNIEDVNIEKEKEKVADDIQTAGVKDMIDTEKELEDGIKKEVYQFAKQQGLDLEKLRKQGVELETIADTIDTVIGDMVSKSAIEYMDQTNQEINWDFEIVGNDIKIVWEKK